jgi:lipoprotein-releasing system ATP-binding protein
MSHSLVVSDLRKAFPAPGGERIEVLCGVSVSVSAGEVVAIKGASGAGKSTLLHLLGGLETAESGVIKLGEFNIGEARPSVMKQFRNNQIGFIFQFHYLLPELTAIENVAMPLLIGRSDRAESLYRASEALTAIGLGERLDHRIGHLSGGEAQRVAVARALITEPKLVLADEPTGNLDGSSGDEIGAALVSYCRRQKAVLVIATHNERLTQICDRVLVLADGQLHEERCEPGP